MTVKPKATAIFKSQSPADTRLLASALAGLLRGGEVLSLKGMIGAGKTFFVQSLAASLGSKHTPVSASFNLMRSYRGKALKIYHFDLFRVAAEEVGNIGMEEYLWQKDGVTAIEWAAPALELYERGEFFEFDFDLAGGDVRKIKARAYGEQAAAALAKLEKQWLKK